MNAFEKLPGFTRLALAVSIILSAACRDDPERTAAPGSAPPVKVRVIAIEARTRTATEDVPGIVRSRYRTQIEARVNGRIDRLLFAQGQVVKEGELLAEIDAREVRARLEAARAQREQAEQDLKRFAQLVEHGAVTRQEFDAAESRARVTRSALAEAETMLAHTSVIAPFAGVVSQKFAEAGDTAGPGRPLLELEDPATLRFEASVPETLIRKIRPGATNVVRLPALEKEFACALSEMAPAADVGSRTFLVKWDLPCDADTRIGVFGRVAIPIAETVALSAPATAIVRRGQLEMVFIVKQGVAELRLVKSGKKTAREIELLAGVSKGETVVSEGAQLLADGQPVEILP